MYRNRGECLQRMGVYSMGAGVRIRERPRACFVNPKAAAAPRLCLSPAIASMPRPILATIHPSALSHNLARVRRAAPDARVWAVVKANAYGHGIERVFDALRSADGFALLDLEEAQRVRAHCWQSIRPPAITTVGEV